MGTRCGQALELTSGCRVRGLPCTELAYERREACESRSGEGGTLVMISDCSEEPVTDCLLKENELDGPVYRGLREAVLI